MKTAQDKEAQMPSNNIVWGNDCCSKEIANPAPELKKAAKRLYEDLKNEKLPYISLDYASSLSDAIQEITPFLQSFKHLLLLGIGGSALGARALQKAFYPCQDWPLHPLNPQDKSLWIADNVDPETLPAWFRRLPPSETLVLVISKSGGTIETMAQYFLAKEWLKTALPSKWQDHLLLITDESKGFLHNEAKELGLRTLPVPQELGGRYSVLCAVGLMPAAFLGMNWQALLAGAKALCAPFNSAKTPEEIETALTKHPAWNLATWAHSLMQEGYSELIYFTYVPKFAAFGDWFAQLWAESLGKNGLGSMPLPAVGVTDQHSLQQMFLDGPRNKACLFISGGNLPAGPTFPEGLSEQWEFLNGRTLNDLLLAETTGTRLALGESKVPLVELRLGGTCENTAGRLMTLLGLATIFTGWLMGINPLDQPAVELGKRLANACLGANGLEEEKSKLAKFNSLQERLQEF